MMLDSVEYFTSRLVVFLNRKHLNQAMLTPILI